MSATRYDGIILDCDCPGCPGCVTVLSGIDLRVGCSRSADQTFGLDLEDEIPAWMIDGRPVLSTEDLGSAGEGSTIICPECAGASHEP